MTDGPRTMPAAISPTTRGCPILRNSFPTILAAASITMMASSLRRLQGSGSAETSSTGTGGGGGPSGRRKRKREHQQQRGAAHRGE